MGKLCGNCAVWTGTQTRARNIRVCVERAGEPNFVDSDPSWPSGRRRPSQRGSPATVRRGVAGFPSVLQGLRNRCELEYIYIFFLPGALFTNTGEDRIFCFPFRVLVQDDVGDATCGSQLYIDSIYNCMQHTLSKSSSSAHLACDDCDITRPCFLEQTEG